MGIHYSKNLGSSGKNNIFLSILGSSLAIGEHLLLLYNYYEILYFYNGDIVVELGVHTRDLCFSVVYACIYPQGINSYTYMK